MIEPVWIMILFLTLNPAATSTGTGSATASVRIGFNSKESCVAAATEVTAGLKAVNRTADVVWSCVLQ